MVLNVVFLTIPLMGLFLSLVSVFIGLGGGVVLVPLLPSVFGLSVHEAVATSLFTIFFVVSENTYRFHKKGQRLIHWPVVLLMGPVSALTAVISTRISQRASPDEIINVLVIILVLIALKNLFSSFFSEDNQRIFPLIRAFRKTPLAETKERHSHNQSTWIKTKGLSSLKFREKYVLGVREKIFSIIGGALAGLVSGFAGVGAGVILSPVMILLKTVKPIQLAPTANANMVFTTSGACLSLFASGLAGSPPFQWNRWGLIRLDIALGLFVSASFFSFFLRPHQNRLPLRIKSILLSLILGGLVFKILYLGVR